MSPSTDEPPRRTGAGPDDEEGRAPSEAPEGARPRLTLYDGLTVVCLDAGVVGVASWLGSLAGEEYARLVAACVRPACLLPAVLFLAGRSWGVPYGELGLARPGAGSWPFFVKFALAVGAAYLVVGVVAVGGIRLLGAPETIESVLGRLSRGARGFLKGPAGTFSFAVLGMVSAPLCEELVFRGVMYAALRSRLRALYAVPASAAIFAAMHLVWHARLFVPWTQLLGGLIFAWAYERTRSIVFPAVFHAIGNLAILAWNLMMAHRPEWLGAVLL